jgi:WhiB family redox-sensing transcriptional regulator
MTSTIATRATTPPSPSSPSSRPDSPSTPCTGDPELWFAETPEALEQAKAMCRGCPLRLMCLQGAIERREPWGVWGGQILDDGRVIPRKRVRGRPRKDTAA